MNGWRKAWVTLLCVALLFSGAGLSIASPEKNPEISFTSVDIANSFIQTTQSGGETVFQLTPNDLPMVKFTPRTDGTEQLVLGDWTAGGDAGTPQMPFKLFRLLVPPDVEMGTAQAALISGQWQALPGAHALAPNPPALTTETILTTLAASVDSSIYDGNAFFPPQPIEIVSVGSFRQWKLVEVRFWPVRYNPVQGRVEQLTQPSISLSLARQADFQPIPEDINAGLFLEQLQQMVDNPQDLTLFYGSNASVINAAGKMVIATTDFLRHHSEKLDNYIGQLQEAGIAVQVITEGSVADNSHYLDGVNSSSRADNLRGWLQTRYLSGGYTDLLLIGDPRQEASPSYTPDPDTCLAMRNIEPGGKGTGFGPSDMYYSELSGTWDVDQDGAFGEYYDDVVWGLSGIQGADKYSELAVGRIPYYGTMGDLDRILEKSMRYRSALPASTAWRQKLLIPAAIYGFAPIDVHGDGGLNQTGDEPNPANRTFNDSWGEALRSLAISKGYTPYTLYEKSGVYNDGTAYPLTACDAPLSVTNVIQAWNQHFGIVSWIGHGASSRTARTRWVTDTQFPAICNMGTLEETDQGENLISSGDCASLDDGFPSFVVAASCNNGYPEDTNNLGYALLKNGAVGTFTACRVTGYFAGSWSPTGLDGQGMGTDYGYYLTRSLMSNTRAGVALNNTRAGSPIQEWGGMVIFNLYGDPTLALNSGGAPYLKLVAPQGGEVWPIGSQQVIGWESSSLAGNVRVDVSRDFGASWQTALASVPNAGSVSWTVTGPVGSLRVRVCSVNSPMLYDASIYDTTIASLQLTSPVGGEIFNKGSDQTISWTSYGINSSGIRIELSRDNGVHWETITPSTGNSGSWPWPVQGEDSAACRIRLTCLDYPILQSASPSPFSINGLTVLNPSGWENLMIGGSHVIQWRSTGVSGNVKIELNREYPGGPWETLFSDVPNNGSRLWTVAGPTSGHARVRIASINNPSHCDISADDFHISNAPLILNIPNGGENWLVGTTQPIRWSYGIFAGKVKIELNRNFPDGPWEMLFSDIPNDGQQPWLVTGPIGNRCRVKVTSMLYPSYTDGSNANFTISPTIVLLTPVGGESWRLGTSQAIQWSGGGFDGAVKIELNRFYPGESWETLFASAPDTGSQLWTVSGVTSVDCRVRISSVEHPAIVSTSPANFTICDVPTLLLRSPSGGETWLEGDQQTITWGSQWYDGLIKIEINRDYPGGAWETLFAATDNDGNETWIVSGSPSPRCRMRISSVGQFAVSSLSARDFTIGYGPSLFYEPYNTPLQFEATVGGDNPPPMVLLLSRQGEGSLNWSAVPANPSFPLSVSPSNGSIGPGKSMLEVGVSIQGLEAGAYAWAIAITAPGAVNSPLFIPITVKVNQALVVAPCALLPGWNLISLPLVTDANPQQVFMGLPAGWLIYAWDAANGRYLGGGDVALALGAGYWLKLPGDTPQSCDIVGVPFPEDTLEIPLANGWNIVGPPYAGITAWGAVRILFAGQSYTLEEAIAHTPPLITAAAFYWTGQAYGNARAAGQFESSRGYWIKALTDRCSPLCQDRPETVPLPK